jgi:DNA-binding transcriptional regulator of glucitol operon
MRQSSAIIVTAVLIVGCAAQKANAPMPADAEAMPPCAVGLTREQFARCNCHPLEARIAQRIQMFEFNDAIKTRINRCVNGKLGVGIRGDELAKVDLSGCVTQEQTLDQEMKAVIVNSINQSKQDTMDLDKARVDSWNITCATSSAATHTNP